MITELINKRNKLWRQILHIQDHTYKTNGYFWNRNIQRQYDPRKVLAILYRKSDYLTGLIQDEYTKIKAGSVGAIENYFKQPKN